jgi:hypothetical protein
MNAYLLFLETWKLECSGNEVRLRLITYFYAGTHGLLRCYPMLSSGYPPAVSEDKVDISCCESTVDRTVAVGWRVLGRAYKVLVHGQRCFDGHESGGIWGWRVEGIVLYT